MARQLRAMKFEAAALLGGYDAWRARFPVVSKGGGQARAGEPGRAAVAEPAPAEELR